MGLVLRPMETGDLSVVGRWLSAPHVARWWLAGSSVERELDDLRQSVTGSQPVHALLVVGDDLPVGWCQWYLCGHEPAWAADVGAAPGDVGIDYAIGEAMQVGRGMGTELVAALVERVRTIHPGCGVMADPDERNVPSRPRPREKRLRPGEGGTTPIGTDRRSGRRLPAAPGGHLVTPTPTRPGPEH